MADFASLAGLVHASPFYHAVYASRREPILSTITIRELHRRGLYFFRPGLFLHLWFKDDKHIKQTEQENADWVRVIDNCFDQALKHGVVPRLSVEQSIFLLG